MTFFLLSIIGFISVHRIICRLQKFFHLNQKKSLIIFTLSIIPIYYFAIFKDHLTCFIIYIGMFLVSLIFFSFIFEKKLKKVFFESHLNIINSLLLQIKAGYSVQKAISESLVHTIYLENIIYEPLRSILKPDFDVKQISFSWLQFYFIELRTILKSETRIADQLELFKQGLKVKSKFLIKTQQVTRQIKAQAVVACLVYILIFLLSYYQLDLMSSVVTVVISICLFLIGIIIIFRLGGKIKWKI